MGAYGGPNIADEGLVFYYDTGNGKSYAGEPTTNLLGTTGDMAPPNPEVPYDLEVGASTSNINGTTWDLSLYPASNLAADNGVSWDPYLKGPGFKGAWKLKKRPGGNGETQFANGLGAVDNTTDITLSVWCKSSVAGIARINTNTTRNGSSYWGYSSGYHTGNGTWQKLTSTIPAGSGVTSINVIRCQVNGTTINTDVYWRHYQIEYGSHPTQFTTGTRSVTEGLKDLAGDTTLDLTDVSFDSNAQMTFDGTDDYIDLGDLGLGAGSFTVEATIYPTLASTYHVFFRKGDDGNSNDNMDWSMGYDYNQFHVRAANASVAVNEYAGGSFVNSTGHVVLTYDGITMRMYKNGTEVLNKTVTFANNYSNYSIGRGINNYANITVKGLKVYNRALTAEEVLNNFNGIRGRFGI